MREKVHVEPETSAQAAAMRILSSGLQFITEVHMYIASTKTWYLERLIRLVAGIFVAGSVLLGILVHPGFFYVTGLVGVMLTIFALTGFCPMSIILHAFGARERCNC